MNLDKQVTLLQDKIDEQDTILSKLKTEQQKMKSHIVEFRQAMKKKTVSKMDAEKIPSVDHEKLTKQLQKQIQNASTMLKNYQNQLKIMQKRSNRVKIDDLAQMEEIIKEKDGKLKKTKEEIKELQFVKRKQQKLIEKKIKQEDRGKLTKLIEEVRKNKETLDNVDAKYELKQENLKKKKQNLTELQKKYQQKCQQNGQIPLTFEEFKEKRKQKNTKSQSVSKAKIKKPQQTVRQIVNSTLHFDNLQFTQKTLNDLRVKKQVAEAALKNAEKKNTKQIQDLTAKMEELQKQNQTLITRLMQKKKEKEMAESGVGSTMSTSKYETSKTVVKLTPLK